MIMLRALIEPGTRGKLDTATLKAIAETANGQSFLAIKREEPERAFLFG